MAPTAGSIAALTRGSLRPAVAARFWRHAPPSQQALERAPGNLLAVGLGKAPLIRQATFSLWDSLQSMNAYARQGAHQAAIEAARAQKFFSESMFVRFVPLAIRGTWKGRVYGDELLRSAD
jgi:heme-degrading monooxygenase HmoA